MGLIISKTPLRVSLVGGGCDFPAFYEQHGGRVLSMAIDKYVYVIIKERFDDLIVLNYTQHEIVDKVDNIKHDLIRECMRWYKIEKGVEITTLADIPSTGSGLGSSSAITVGLLNAMAHYVGTPTTQDDLASIACIIEIGILGRPIGKQDQYGTAIGGLKTIYFKEDDSVFAYRWGNNVHSLSHNLFLHYTGITRDANKILAKQVGNMSQNTEGLKRLLEITTLAGKALETNKIDYVGYLMKEGWDIKKKFAKDITNDAIDGLVNRALRSGATGCKITGAGGGGFLLSYVPAENHFRFREGMKGIRELPFDIDNFGSRIIFNIA